jgi:hypothetical protein
MTDIFISDFTPVLRNERLLLNADMFLQIPKTKHKLTHTHTHTYVVRRQSNLLVAVCVCYAVGPISCNENKAYTLCPARMVHWTLPSEICIWVQNSLDWRQAQSRSITGSKNIDYLVIFYRFLYRYIKARPITVAAQSEAWTVSAHSDAVIIGSNPTQGIDVWRVYVYEGAI